MTGVQGLCNFSVNIKLPQNKRFIFRIVIGKNKPEQSMKQRQIANRSTDFLSHRGKNLLER